MRPTFRSPIVLLLPWLLAIPSAASHPFEPPEAIRHETPSRDYDLLHVKLDLRLDFERRSVAGVSTLSLKPFRPGLRTIRLHAAEMEVLEAREGSRSLRFSRDKDVLSVDLGRNAAPEETLVLEVRYEATPQQGLVFITPDRDEPDRPLQAWTQGEPEDNRYWFPCYDYPNDRVTSEVLVSVPERFTTVSNGRLVEVTDAGRGERRWHWKQEQPHSTYLISLIVGELEEVKDEWDGIPLLYYVPRGEAARARVTFRNTPDMMRFFSERLGRYPWPKYAQTTVRDFGGGMENTSATTLGDGCLYDERVASEHSSDGLIAHELAHQWFGDLVTTKDWSHLWLNEGFATYLEALYTEHAKGQDELEVELMGMKAGYLASAGAYKRPIVTYLYKEPWSLFDGHTYPKGGWVVHMLRRELGDEDFWKAIRHYLQTHAGRNVDTWDLIHSITEATGRHLEPFFEQWVFSPGHPEFRVRWSWDEERKQAHVNLRQVQKLEGGVPLFRVPLTLSFRVDGRDVDFPVVADRAEQDLYFPLAARPTMVIFDKGSRVLCTLDFEKSPEEWAYQLRHAPSVRDRVEAAEALGKAPSSREGMDALMSALESDPFWRVREEAVRALGATAAEAATRALLKRLGEERDGRVRRHAAAALGRAPVLRTEVVSALRKALREDPSDWVRASSARSVADLDPHAARPALLEALKQDSQFEMVRQAVFDKLAEARDDAALGTVLEWTRPGRPREARQAALRALGRIGLGSARARGVLLGLLEADAKGSPVRGRSLQMTAIRVLGERGEREALPVLRKLAAVPRDTRQGERLATAAREAIERIEKAQAEKEGVGKLQQEVSRLREETERLRKELAEVRARGPEPRKGDAAAARPVESLPAR